MSLSDLILQKIFYFKPIGVKHIPQSVAVLQNVVIQVGAAGIIQIVLIRKIFQHRPGNFLRLVQVQGHKIILIEIGDPKLRFHAGPVPLIIRFSHPARFYQQGADFLKQLRVFLFPVKALHGLKQHLGILPQPPGEIEHLFRSLPSQDSLPDAVIKHLALESAQLSQKRGISV